MSTLISPFLSNLITLPTKPPLLAALTPVIICGPRDNRGPIQRGRTLSAEAILAVQSLKRSPHLDPSTSPAFSRLLKPDLRAALAELLRQGYPLLAIRLLSLLRSDPSGYSPDLSLYADIVSCLARNNLEVEAGQFVDEIVSELRRGGGIKGEDLRRPARLIKSLVAAGRGDNAREVYGLLKEVGCGPNEYLFKFLARGLRRLGDKEGAMEVERDYEDWDVRGVWGKSEEEAEEEALPVR